MSTTTTPVPYGIFTLLKRAGWVRNFEISQGGKVVGNGHLMIRVSGAPAIGSCPGDYLFAGSWTSPDGTTLFQRSNMDRSVRTIVIGPDGAILHNFNSDTLIESAEQIRKLNLI